MRFRNRRAARRSSKAARGRRGTAPPPDRCWPRSRRPRFRRGPVLSPRSPEAVRDRRRARRLLSSARGAAAQPRLALGSGRRRQGARLGTGATTTIIGSARRDRSKHERRGARADTPTLRRRRSRFVLLVEGARKRRRRRLRRGGARAVFGWGADRAGRTAARARAGAVRGARGLGTRRLRGLPKASRTWTEAPRTRLDSARPRWRIEASSAREEVARRRARELLRARVRVRRGAPRRWWSARLLRDRARASPPTLARARRDRTRGRVWRVRWKRGETSNVEPARHGV